MKIGSSISMDIAKILLGTIILALFCSIMAQSGRVIPPSTPAPTLTEANPPSAKSAFVPDPKADKYKIVFAKSMEGKLSYSSKETADLKRAMYLHKANFIQQLNKEGELGYRFIASTKDGLALIKRGNIQYEYTWFLTTSNSFWAKQGFEAEYVKRTREGFSLTDHLFLSGSCEIPPSTPYNELPEVHADRCEFNDLFILTRVKGDESPQQYRLAQHIPRRSTLPDEATLTEQLSEDLAKAFYPTHAFSKHEVLSQSIVSQELFSRENVELRVVTGAVQKKVNELAQQGFRLVITNYEIAVLTRRKGDTTPVSYIWLDATKKDFPKQLSRIQEQGAVYIVTYPNRHGDKSNLIFELRGVNNDTQREYKILKVEVQDTENVTEQKIFSDFTPASKQTMELLNQLDKEGFEARDLFTSDKNIYGKTTTIYKASVLLERSR